MKNHNDEMMIKNALGTINTPQYDIFSEVKKKINKKAFYFKKIISIAAAACLCMTLTICVAAATIPSFNKLLSIISPDMALFLKPVEMSSEDQGIKMEVVAVGRYDTMVKLYVTLQDLIGDRIGADTNFSEYYRLIGVDNTCSWKMIDYDEQSGKATMLIEADSKTKFDGQKLTFKVGKIYYNNKEYEDYQLGIDLSKISHEAPSVQITPEQLGSWWGGEIYGQPLREDIETIPVLKPHMMDIRFPETKRTTLSNVGIIDGKLHVQLIHDTKYSTHYSTMAVGIRNLVGERFSEAAHFSFGVDESGNVIDLEDTGHRYYINEDTYSHTRYAIEELIFEVDIDKLDEYELLGYFRGSEVLEGDWQVTFKAEDSGTTLESSSPIDAGGILIDKICINSFGINLIGKIDNDVDISTVIVKVKTENDVIDASFSSSNQDNGIFTAILRAEKPINIDLVKSVTINGETVVFEK